MKPRDWTDPAKMPTTIRTALRRAVWAGMLILNDEEIPMPAMRSGDTGRLLRVRNDATAKHIDAVRREYVASGGPKWEADILPPDGRSRAARLAKVARQLRTMDGRASAEGNRA